VGRVIVSAQQHCRNSNLSATTLLSLGGNQSDFRIFPALSLRHLSSLFLLKFDLPKIRARPFEVINSTWRVVQTKVAAFESVQDEQTAIGLINCRLGVVRQFTEAETGSFELVWKKHLAVASVNYRALRAIRPAAPGRQDVMPGEIHAFFRGVPQIGAEHVRILVAFQIDPDVSDFLDFGGVWLECRRC
jgi:hypothetical protein